MSRRKPVRKKKKQASKPNWFIPVIIAVAVVFIGGGALLVNSNRQKPSAADTELTLRLGETVYQENCAACHGERGEGHIQLDAPALDGTEHAWHHSDTQIIGLIRTGGQQMPPVGANFTPEEVDAVIAYVKQWWTLQQRNAQQGTIGE